MNMYLHVLDKRKRIIPDVIYKWVKKSVGVHVELWYLHCIWTVISFTIDAGRGNKEP